MEAPEQEDKVMVSGGVKKIDKQRLPIGPEIKG